MLDFLPPTQHTDFRPWRGVNGCAPKATRHQASIRANLRRRGCALSGPKHGTGNFFTLRSAGKHQSRACAFRIFGSRLPDLAINRAATITVSPSYLPRANEGARLFEP